MGAIGVALALPAGADTKALRIAFVERSTEGAEATQRGYAGIAMRERRTAAPGAELALRDSRAMALAAGLSFELLRRIVTGGDVAAEIRALVADPALRAVILDLPRDEVRGAAIAFTDASIPFFNIRHRDTALRVETCKTTLHHSIPSQAMLADALAQYLYFKNWRRILVLEGNLPDDVEVSKAFQNAAKKFGLRVAAVKRFVLGNDPRQRDQINVALMTAEADHDVVFVADTIGEFARYVAYRTTHPRPVVGADGLRPAAWHPAWERHGAPQLSRRFERMAGRPMSDEDWAAWVAARAVVQASIASAGAAGAVLTAELARPELTLELYKGAPGSFRPWDRQLRQPILLHTHNAVVERAPLDGFLHERNNLDTLGLDAPEWRCER